ncbi:nucleoside triphosphate pyrophosphohydrolase [Roseococcus pinisoli]|uniref:Nucleoside triphosphate pyrophosphohydrolase n=1 Tax=Roseococcus pinisoli TaxID=2835040 RepID=A0ABS5QDI0_9PROT|nr:nucleoside triphosphate pyrophosphohydrolase [Roseococcus pinisoli]MBS7811528.1 nucleoside triphosphate pyrophosphohydrolase [Roseococcus pinisoli]
MTDAPSIDALLSVMVQLRDPETGCPWDVAQDFSTIAPFTVEEAYEVADAIRRGPEPSMLVDELGDLLLQVVYHSRLAEERGWFRFEDVAAAVTAKMIRRHPHVFGDADASQATDIWEGQKAAERAARAETGALAGIATGLPSLTRASKIAKRAARVGFDWPDAASVLGKLDEETAELRAELEEANPARLADEVGDLLFVLANLARKLDLDPEVCLEGANRKFERRFGAVEASLATQGRAPADATLEEMEEAWREAKRKGL